MDNTFESKVHLKMNWFLGRLKNALKNGRYDRTMIYCTSIKVIRFTQHKYLELRIPRNKLYYYDSCDFMESFLCLLLITVSINSRKIGWGQRGVLLYSG